MIQKKHIKKITTFLLLIVTILTLVACTKKESIPYGSVSDEAYLSLGDNTITEREVYDNLRRQSGSTLPTLIENKLFEGYKDRALTLLATANAEEDSEADKVQKAFDNIVNAAMFSSGDVDAIKEFPAINIQIGINGFVDTIYVQNGTVDRASLKTALNVILEDSEAEGFATGYYNIPALRDHYLLNIQKRLYAEEVLAEEVLDEDNSNFVTDANVITYYNNNIKGRNDANVFMFHFLSLNEANAALRQVSLKANSRGHWFQVPDIRLVADIEAYPESVNEYLWTLLDDLKLKDKALEVDPDDATKTMINEKDFKSFYDAYSLSETRDERLTANLVLEKFVELYNVVNDNGLTLTLNGGNVIGSTFVDENGNDFKTLFTYDDLSSVNASLRNYVYDSLTAEKPYSTLRTVGSFRYLVFKLDENYNELNYVSENLTDDNTQKWVTIDELKEMFEDEDKHDDLLEALKLIDGVVSNDVVNWEALETVMEENIAEWTKEVVNAKLTTSYINTKANEVINEADIEIFDNTARIFFNQSRTNKATGKAKTGNDLLTFKGELNEDPVEFTITVDEFFAYSEQRVGVETAIDLLLNKYLLAEYRKDSPMFADLDLNEKEFRNEYKDFINAFSSNQYEQAGYPASLGRETFLLLIFGTTNVDEIIEIGYIIPELRESYSTNYDVQLGSVNVFEQLEYFTQLQYEKSRGLTVSHLLVYFDTNGDGTPEDPNEYLADLDEDKVTEIKEAIVELYDEILFHLGQKGSDFSQLSTLATEFQEYARIDVLAENFLTKNWEKYRKLGLNLKFETISSEISNTSNFPGGSTLDKVFYDRAMELLQIIEDDREADEEELTNDGLPYLDFAAGLNTIQVPDVDVLSYLDEDGIMSSFGFHFILVNSTTEKLSAEYDGADDTKGDYKITIDEVEYNAYNENERISQSQIEYYLRGNQLEEGALLPSKVSTAFTKYFTPIQTLYNGNIMRVEILNELLATNNVNTHGKDARFDAIREINRNQFHNYLLGLVDENGDDLLPDYTALYGEWFARFGLEN